MRNVFVNATMVFVGSGLRVWCGQRGFLAHVRQGDFHIYTVARDILDCALGRLGLPAWLRVVYFALHRQVRSRFRLLGWELLGPGMETWKVSKALLLSYMPITLSAFRMTRMFFSLLLNTRSRAPKLPGRRLLRNRMTAWRYATAGCLWTVKLDVRDLGGHLDVTLRALAGTLGDRVSAAGALPHGGPTNAWDGVLQVSNLLAGLHWCEGAAISVSFRSVVAHGFQSEKLSKANTLALLSLLDALGGSDPAFFVIRSS